MKSTVNSIHQIETFLKKRFTLSPEIINFLASEIYIRNHKEHTIQIMYRKRDDRIFTNKWDFNLQYILSRHYTQCACCGNWYKENLSGDFLSTSVMTVYIPFHGYDISLNLCSPCTLEHDHTLMQIDNMIEAILDDLLTFREAFKPITHVKA